MNPFATLGLAEAYPLDSEELEQRYRALQRALHPDKHQSGTPSERRQSLARAMEVNEAYRIVRDDIARGEALLALRVPDAANSKAAADPALLMDMMERREALAEAKAARNLESVKQMAAEVMSLKASAMDGLGAAFTADSTTARDWLAKLKYYARFLDEVSVIEDLLEVD